MTSNRLRAATAGTAAALLLSLLAGCGDDEQITGCSDDLALAAAVAKPGPPKPAAPKPRPANPKPKPVLPKPKATTPKAPGGGVHIDVDTDCDD